MSVPRLTPCLTPHGHLVLAPAADAPELEPALAERIGQAFARGAGHGRVLREKLKTSLEAGEKTSKARAIAKPRRTKAEPEKSSSRAATTAAKAPDKLKEKPGRPPKKIVVAKPAKKKATR